MVNKMFSYNQSHVTKEWPSQTHRPGLLIMIDHGTNTRSRIHLFKV